MTHKPITTAAAVVALVLSGGALAATDDMGMQYTSASEGLSGSFRVNLYNAESKPHPDDIRLDRDTVLGAGVDSLRLVFTGSADLGNGMSSTYQLDLRPKVDGDEANDGTTVDNYNIGLTGVFGNLQFGRMCGAACMVPGGSLDSIKGSSRQSPSSDPGDGTFRFTSPSINGLQFGFSAQLNDSGDNADPNKPSDNLLNELSFAAVYDTPLGLKLGAAYEKDSDPTKYEDDITGYRFGAQYGQDNWKVAYEFRAYDNFGGGINTYRDVVTIAAPTVFTTIESPVTVNGTVTTSLSTMATPVTRGPIIDSVSGNTITVAYDEKGQKNDKAKTNDDKAFENKSTVAVFAYIDNALLVRDDDTVVWHGDGRTINDYAVHAFGVQFSLDKVTASANYSIEEVSYDAVRTNYTPTSLERTALGVDIKYALGSKSSILFGFKSVEKETHQRDNLERKGTNRDESETTLRYQVDF